MKFWVSWLGDAKQTRALAEQYNAIVPPVGKALKMDRTKWILITGKLFIQCEIFLGAI